MEVNEEKRQKFMEYAAKRVNNVIHDISILEPMARSNSYDFTKADVDEMFAAIQSSLNSVKEEYNRKFEAKSKTLKQAFSFGQSKVPENNVEELNFNVENVNDVNDGVTIETQSNIDVSNSEETVTTSLE